MTNADGKELKACDEMQTARLLLQVELNRLMDQSRASQLSVYGDDLARALALVLDATDPRCETAASAQAFNPAQPDGYLYAYDGYFGRHWQLDTTPYNGRREPDEVKPYWFTPTAAPPSPPHPDAAAKDLYALGISVMKDGERVDPRELYTPPDIAQVRERFEAFMRTQGETQFDRYDDGEYIRPINFDWAVWCAALGVKP